MTAAPFGSLADLADRLDALAEETGDPRCRVAAAILRGKRPGRPAIDDEAALGLAASLVTAGLARSTRDACRRAARFRATSSTDVMRITERLRKKLGRK